MPSPSRVKRRTALSLAAVLVLAVAIPVHADSGWLYVGSGPMATSTARTVAVRTPGGLVAGDLLLLSCQGRRDAMQWSAPGYTSLVSYDDQWPQGPPGLQFELLWRWATAADAASVTVTNTTGVNGWSCVISAFRGGLGSGQPWEDGHFSAGGVISPSGNRVMYQGAATAEVDQCLPGAVCPDRSDYLWVYWFISRDDNNHGGASGATAGFGGTAYDTTMGTDHASSMVYHVGYLPGPPHNVTMRQRSHAPDAWTSFSAAFAPAND
jgi:hypothetical protein